MGSQRFPGKVVAPLLGKPVLQHVIERCNRIRGPLGSTIQVVVAVPDTPESEPILQLTDKMHIHSFLGSELNVLDRYYKAAMHYKFDYIVRITADCPFIDPIVCVEVLHLLIWRKCDYVSNCHIDRTYPKGLDCEAFTLDCLEVAYMINNTTAISNLDALKEVKHNQEHVTPWMINEPIIKKALIKQKKNMSHLNYCVDYPKDIKRLEKLVNDQKLNLLKVTGQASNDNSPTR